MRVLFSCHPAIGHLNPLIPVAHALVEAGHEVRFGVDSELCGRVQRAGFVAIAAGMTPREKAEAHARWQAVHARALAEARHLDDEAWAVFQQSLTISVFGVGMFARPQALDLLTIIRDWRPDLVVHDALDYGAPIAASAAGLPYASVGVGAPLPLLAMLTSAGEQAAPLWAEFGLEADDLGGMHRFLYLDNCPPSLQTPEIDALGSVVPLRPEPVRVDDADVPDWLASLGDRPVVHVTLGTVANDDPSLFYVLLRAVRGAPVSVVASVGPGVDPRPFRREQTSNVRVAQFVPHGALLDRCAAVVCHGGSGTVTASLRAAVPLVCIPQAFDHFAVASACARRGVGVTVSCPDVAVPALRDAFRSSVRTALDEVLGRDAYHQAAGEVAGEIAAMPAPVDVVPLLERLAP